MSHTILIIENQREHFEKLFKGLSSNEVIVRPSLEGFVGMMSAVKVYLNTNGYEQKYHDACWRIIEKNIKDEQGKIAVDLIIMDNILGGSTVCRTGQDLAKDIWDRISKTIPVLFLSRTEFSDKQRFEMEESFYKNKNRFEWLMKGFLGSEMVEDPYITQTVAQKVRDMLTKNWTEESVSNPNQFAIDCIEKILAIDTLTIRDRDGFQNLKKKLDSQVIIAVRGGELAKELEKRLQSHPKYDSDLEKIVEKEPRK